jgi:hypothetical protein
MGVLLVVVYLLAAPLAGWCAGNAAYHASTRTERAERADRTLTHAVLLVDASPVAVGFAVVPKVPVPARWTAPDGSERTGAIVVSMSAPAGTAVPIWTDPAGNRVDPPRDRDQTLMRASVAAMVAGLGLTLLLAGARAALRRTLNRRRMAAWDAEWSLVAPRWTSHR